MRQESIQQLHEYSANGDPSAATRLGLFLCDNGQIPQGKDLLQHVANDNILWANNICLYLNEVQTIKQPVSRHALVTTQALAQIEQAALKNHPFALAALGEMCYFGHTVPQRSDYGIECLNKAAEANVLWAQDLLVSIKDNSTNLLDKFKVRTDPQWWVANKQKHEEAEITVSKDAMEELGQLIGLQRVKQEVKTLRDFVSVQKQRENKGLKGTSVSYHCVFSGNPGTGKTTVARIVAKIYKELGILKKGHLVEVQRADLIGEYVGQTAPKTNAKIDEALDGILFIDEAYTLAQGGQNDFGNEAVATLLKRMEDDRNRLVVILAGYDNEIRAFIDMNPGLQSRFNRYIHFDDYSPDELLQIFIHYLNKAQYGIDEKGVTSARKTIDNAVANKDPHFGNARYVRNMFEKIIQQQARRVARLTNPTKEQLYLLNEDDVTASVH